VVLDAGEVLLHGGVDLLQLPPDPLRHHLLLHRAAPPAWLLLEAFAACGRGRKGQASLGDEEERNGRSESGGFAKGHAG